MEVFKMIDLEQYEEWLDEEVGYDYFDLESEE